MAFLPNGRFARFFARLMVVIGSWLAGSALPAAAQTKPAAQTPPAAARPPNVVILLADDQGWGDLSLHGNTNLQTPNIDALAAEGARFDRFFVCTVCAPTRAEMLTGRYYPRTGVRGVSEGLERLNLDERTIAEAFQAAGYATGAFGKWHNGSQWPYHPNARGFDEYYGFASGHWGEYFDPPLEHNGRPVRGRGYVADVFTDRAMEFIERNRTRPFFCYVPFNTPHSPWAVPDAYWNRFRNKELALRGDAARENLDETLCVLAMCENLDGNVGRILRKLDELGLADNTIVVYFSDNGPNTPRWNGGMKGKKGSIDEGGLRVPCFVRWPDRIAPGTFVREIAGAIDLLPTLTALAGVDRVGDQPLDGVDLSPLLVGPRPDAWPERVILSCWDNAVTARSQRYRLDARGALFDLDADPGQQRDLAGERVDAAAELAEAVQAWRRDVLGGRGRRGGAAGDRPYPVGYAEFPVTVLPARDGVPHGGVQRSASAPNCSYFVNWRDAAGFMTWDVEVNAAGEYEAVVHYTCPAGDEGSLVELSFNGANLEARVSPAWDPPLYENQDTIKRPDAESQMKEFRPLELGRIRLPAGRGKLTLRARDVSGRSVMEVRSITLTLRTDGGGP